MRNFIITTEDEVFEVTAMYDEFGRETHEAPLAEAIVIKFGEDEYASTDARGRKVWTLQ